MKPLLLVDIQNDFLPGGALAVPEGDRVIPVANRLMPHFDLVVATQDWHPPEHRSFAANHPGRKVGEVIDLDGLPQVLWPVHCVQGSRGAELAPELNTSGIHHIVHKGTDPLIDSYSALYDNAHRKATGLAEFLRRHGVSDFYLMGLATDYCVKFTTLDALAEGFRVHVIVDACRGVELKKGDVEAAMAQVKAAGAEIVHSANVARTRRAESGRSRPG